jgi:hypothetical protein
MIERSQSWGTRSRMLKACLNIKIHHFNDCDSMFPLRRASRFPDVTLCSSRRRCHVRNHKIFQNTVTWYAMLPPSNYTKFQYNIYFHYNLQAMCSRSKAARPWCWPQTPSKSEVKERVQLYISPRHRFFLVFPRVFKQMLRWFPTLPVATTCFSCSPLDVNLVANLSHVLYMC